MIDHERMQRHHFDGMSFGYGRRNDGRKCLREEGSVGRMKGQLIREENEEGKIVQKNMEEQ